MNEQSFRPAWRSFYGHIVTMIACLGIVLTLSIKMRLSSAYLKGIWSFYALFLLFSLGNMVFRRFQVVLTVKPDGIALEKGIIGRHSIVIGFKNIRTIQVKQNLMQRILNVGDLLIASSGADNYEIHINNMLHPQEIRDMMQTRERAVAVAIAAAVAGEDKAE